ncbi:metallophosphoesterase [Sphingosinithalassobacter sp. CS137]|uniref:metallophosphoesterase n=1 Tax=Sphingosinithalassobacter sp. CS137 TaxID=2762748 RepID=UPI0021D27321|nr:metallophosphoesterase [Sphingosinithalassobacter sp. CS137]
MGAPLGFRYVRSAQGEGDSSMVKRVTLGVLLLAGVGVAVLLFAFIEARSDPVVREARIAMRDWPEGAPPLRLVLVSDIHLGSPAMDGARLDRIVTQINALDPDLVVIAGDFIFGHERGSAAMLGAGLPASLARLDAPLGTVAALGNHDHWTGIAAVREQLERAGVAVVENGAIRRGPIVLGVVGDDFTRHDDIPATLAAMAELEGPQVVLSHSPDIAPELPPEVALVLAGHTHCGQVVPPLIGPLVSVSRYGERYRCGVRREGGRLVVVTAGLGTSGPPLRMGAPPDLWLLTLVRPQSRARR